MRELLEQTSGKRVTVRTSDRMAGLDVLAEAGATVAVTDAETLTVTGLAAERIATLLAGAGVPFSEIGQHRASLEDVYMEMTRSHTTFSSLDESAVRA